MKAAVEIIVVGSETVNHDDFLSIKRGFIEPDFVEVHRKAFVMKCAFIRCR